MEKVTVNKGLFEIRETLKLFILYLGVAFSAIPTGLYFYFIAINHTFFLIIALCLGFVLANEWRSYYLSLLSSKENCEKLREEIGLNFLKSQITLLGNLPSEKKLDKSLALRIYCDLRRINRRIWNPVIRNKYSEKDIHKIRAEAKFLLKLLVDKHLKRIKKTSGKTKNSSKGLEEFYGKEKEI